MMLHSEPAIQELAHVGKTFYVDFVEAVEAPKEDPVPDAAHEHKA